jgi:hypothetical protein
MRETREIIGQNVSETRAGSGKKQPVSAREAAIFA